MTPEIYRKHRNALNITQAELAKRLEVTRQCITLRETGRAPIDKEAQIAIVALLAKVKKTSK